VKGRGREGTTASGGASESHKLMRWPDGRMPDDAKHRKQETAKPSPPFDAPRYPRNSSSPQWVAARAPHPDPSPPHIPANPQGGTRITSAGIPVVTRGTTGILQGYLEEAPGMGFRKGPRVSRGESSRALLKSSPGCSRRTPDGGGRGEREGEFRRWMETVLHHPILVFS
jgi:hypothetical protein